MKKYDIVIIGAGPGGCACAEELARHNKSVAIVDSLSNIGGTCLHTGCIPSKFLLSQALQQRHVRGIYPDYCKDYVSIYDKRQSIIQTLCHGLTNKLKHLKIELINGFAQFVDKNTIEISSSGQKIYADSFVIATGSLPKTIPSLNVDGEQIIFSNTALEIEPPHSAIIVGGGVIGVEIGSMWASFGSKVTIIDIADKLLPEIDIDLSSSAMKIMQKNDVNVLLKSGIASIEKSTIVTNDGSFLEAEKIVVAIGRSPNISNLQLEKVGIEIEFGAIRVNDQNKTNVENIFAIGDVILNGPALAHKAERDGLMVAKTILGEYFPPMQSELIPKVIYTHPEIASIGISSTNDQYISATCFATENGRAMTEELEESYVKIVADKLTGKICGVHVVSPQAGAIINSASILMAYDAFVQDLKYICFAHPEMSEMMRDACMKICYKLNREKIKNHS